MINFDHFRKMNSLLMFCSVPFEGKVFTREHMNNWYSVGAYVTSKIISSLPLQIICPTIFISIAYFMTGQPHEVQRFLLLWAILILVAVMADCLGLFVGAACNIQVIIKFVTSLNRIKIAFFISAWNFCCLCHFHSKSALFGILH